MRSAFRKIGATAMSLQFDAESHIYRVNGVVYPSVTQILSGMGLLPDYSKLDPFYRERGTAVHACIKMRLLGEEIDWDFEGADEVRPRFDRFLWFDEEYDLKPYVIEEPLHSRYGYAGTPDLVAFSGKLDKLVFVDWKGDAREKGQDLQIEAYAQLVSEDTKRLLDPVNNSGSKTNVSTCPAYIVTLGGNGPRPGIHQVNRSVHNRELFLAAVAVYNWRTKNVRAKNGS